MTLLDPNIVSDNDGPKLHNEVLPTKSSQFNTKDFASKWLEALEESIGTRQIRHDADTNLLPIKGTDPVWKKAYVNHEDRLKREKKALVVTKDYLSSLN